MNSPVTDNYSVFEAEVKNHFHFLEKDFGFRLSRIDKIGFSKLIRFESPRVYVNLSYGPPAYEVALSFGRIGIDDVPGAYSFEQGDLVLLSSCAGWKWNPNYPNHLIGLITEFARLLRECGSACLCGDQSIFGEMKKTRDAAIKNWHQEERANSIRKEIESAWGKKDYVSVVTLCESIKETLTDTEIKKMEYAKKQLQS